MTWTATRGEVMQGDDWSFAIIYTDGVQKLLRGYHVNILDDSVIQTTARGEVDRLSMVTGSAGKLTIQLGQEIDLTLPADPPPDARAIFDAAAARLIQLQRFVQLGVLQSNDQRVTDAQNAVKAAWQDSFLP